jgi:hypothetical protein
VQSPIAGLFVALGVTAIAASAATPPAPPLTKWQQAQQEKFKNSAPADEYFGKMKMSFLGMNNTFRDAAISSGDHTTDSGIINKVKLAEDALEAWGKKYPRDPQLARTYYLATLVERKIWTKANQDHAWIYLNRLISLFPDSYFGKVLKKDLAIGFTEHYYAPPVACVTPSPTPLPTDTPPFATPTPLVEPTDAPTPSPIPSPTVTTVAKGLKVEIIFLACVPPPTPSPSPSPSPSPTASPSPTVSPSASASPDASATPAAASPAK